LISCFGLLLDQVQWPIECVIQLVESLEEGYWRWCGWKRVLKGFNKLKVDPLWHMVQHDWLLGFLFS